jgi:signal transduction histidine kinase
MKVLVVDGNATERRAIALALERLEQVAVVGAIADQATALRVLGEAGPDVVVIGTELADGSGLDLIQEIRASDQTPAIVVVGKEPSRAEWRRHLDAGADRFVEPDPDLAELVEVVTSLGRRAPGDGSDMPLRMMGQLAADIAHDFNNYLNILGMALAMIDETPDDRALWREAYTTLDQATRLTSTLLGFVRGIHRDPAPLDFGALVETTARLAQRAMPPGIHVAVAIERDVPAIRGLASELEQLVLNLVLNAAEAAGEGGEVGVRVAAAGEGALLEVTDSGDQGRVAFLGFALGASAPGARALSSKRVGTGLGLGIVRAVAQRHQAVIRVAARDARGTVIRVVLPS